MDQEELFNEYAGLAKRIGMPVEDILRLSVDMVSAASTCPSSGYIEQHAAIEGKRKILRKKILSRARRTNGSLTFPV
jgi:hypothetical protein